MIHAAIDINGAPLVDVEIVRQVDGVASLNDYRPQKYAVRAYAAGSLTREFTVMHVPADKVWALLTSVAERMANP